MKLVPEPSERCTVVMSLSGRFTLGLSFLMAGSFHLAISPMKILARVGPSKTSWPACNALDD